METNIDFSWAEVISLLKAYRRAIEEENEEDIVHITNVLPGEIRILGDDIIIKI